MIKHDYKQVNKGQPQEEQESILETIMAGIAFVALVVSVSSCIYIVGAMQ